MRSATQKPHRWDRHRDAPCCIECEKPFARGDMVYTDCAVNVHVGCLEAYGRTLVELGLRKVRKDT